MSPKIKHGEHLGVLQVTAGNTGTQIFSDKEHLFYKMFATLQEGCKETYTYKTLERNGVNFQQLLA